VRYLEPLDVVNDSGGLIAPAPRGLIHRIGLRHKTVFVFIVSHDEKLLLQKRGKEASSSQFRLDISVGGHVIAGESNLKLSAVREMTEELGFAPDESRLVFVAEYNRDSPLLLTKPFEKNRERRTLFEYVLTKEESGTIKGRFDSQASNNNEVESLEWFTVDEVIEAINSGNTADGLLSNFLCWLPSYAGR
jgi:isopentenyldiphosphate isomerase